ncbi:MAG TPA: hypothetical protein VM307_00890 [Egibacteraceae bacterium]|jgi:hypothetical protein|nr:hypothetical protein [Egibacteraceae bacterium]
MKLLTARDTGPTFYFVVHLDPSKTLDNGDPDPAFVAEYTWPKSGFDGTPAQVKARILNEVRLLAIEERKQRLAAASPASRGTKLPEEGKEL